MRPALLYWTVNITVWHPCHLFYCPLSCIIFCRVIQTHFASANNVGAVAAKEEVWEVVGQLAGYATSLALLQGLENTGKLDG